MSGLVDVATNSAGARFQLRARGCPTCGDGPTRLLGYRGGRYQRGGLGIETTIVQCELCSLIFPNPFPYAVDVSDLYGDPHEYFSGWDEEEKVRWFRPLVHDLIGRAGRSAARLLDVGCGRGEFLRAAQAEGMKDVLGLELSTETASHARSRGVPVLTSTLEQFVATEPGTFDVLVLNAVLEHVYDPDSMIAAAGRITHPGAVLYIEVPCEPYLLAELGNGLNRLRHRRGVYNLTPTWPPYHVFGFNPKALRALLAKHGFEIDSVRRWSNPVVHSSGGGKDWLRAIVATQVNRVANVVGMASNMFVWARRVR